MKIDKNAAVTARLRITDDTGKLLEDDREPVAYLHGHGNLFPKLEELLAGREAGFKATLELAPEDAFGLRDDRLALTIPKSQFPPGVKIGGQLERRGEDGHARQYTVVKIKGNQVLLDGNHPYAGKTLRIALSVLAVRPATSEEIAHGHVHGAHGHHH